MKNIAFLFFLFLIPLIAESQLCAPVRRQVFERTFMFKDSSMVTGYNYFKRHGIVFDSLTNKNLYNEVIKWIGTPYRWAGKTRYGVDCSGFVTQIYNSIYSIKLGGGAGDIFKLTTPIEKKDLKEGDLVFFKIRHNHISHVALYLSNNKIIHATTAYGVRIDDLNAPYYLRYYFSCGRIVSAEKNIYTGTN